MNFITTIFTPLKVSTVFLFFEEKKNLIEYALCLSVSVWFNKTLIYFKVHIAITIKRKTYALLNFGEHTTKCIGHFCYHNNENETILFNSFLNFFWRRLLSQGNHLKWQPWHFLWIHGFKFPNADFHFDFPFYDTV